MLVAVYQPLVVSEDVGCPRGVLESSPRAPHIYVSLQVFMGKIDKGMVAGEDSVLYPKHTSITLLARTN